MVLKKISGVIYLLSIWIFKSVLMNEFGFIFRKIKSLFNHLMSFCDNKVKAGFKCKLNIIFPWRRILCLQEGEVCLGVRQHHDCRKTELKKTFFLFMNDKATISFWATLDKFTALNNIWKWKIEHWKKKPCFYMELFPCSVAVVLTKLLLT